jgi:hypothetical protein
MNCNIELACTKDLKRSQTQSWRTHKAQERPTCIYIHNLYINASINLSIYLFYLSIHPPILPSIHASIYKYLSYLDMHLLFAYPYYLCIYLGTIEHIISSIIYIYIYIYMYIQRKSLWGPTAWQKCVFFSIGRRPCKSSAPPSCVLTISSKVLRCRRKENMDLSEK